MNANLPAIEAALIDDIRARDAQTEVVPVGLLPLGMTGTKYDHARRRTSAYHLDSSDIAMGDRHVLLGELRRRRVEDRGATYKAWKTGYDGGFRQGEEWAMNLAAVAAIAGALIGVTVGWLGHRRSSR